MTNKRDAGSGVDSNVTVSPLLINVVLQLAEKADDAPNDAANRQLFYSKLQQAMREHVTIEATENY